MDRKIILTADGSPSVWVPQLQESYHSKFGAVQESMHVYINAGLKPLLAARQEIRILEIGFGTGLNCLLSLEVATNTSAQIYYHALEPYPIAEEQVHALNTGYSKCIGHNEFDFLALHQSAWDVEVAIRPGFILEKAACKLELFTSDQFFHLVYFDAFSPTVQPELWTTEIFSKISNQMATGAILTTYCSKGAVRRAMRAAGLEVEKLPGPPGKKEMIRAWKK